MRSSVDLLPSEMVNTGQNYYLKLVKITNNKETNKNRPFKASGNGLKGKWQMKKSSIQENLG